jgi:hypothetical protein
MPIVINDFEIVVEPPKKPQEGAKAETAEGQPPPNLRPSDITQILRRERERKDRVRAT